MIGIENKIARYLEDKDIIMESGIKDAIKKKIDKKIINFLISIYLKEIDKSAVDQQREKDISNREKYNIIIYEIENKGLKGPDMLFIKNELRKRLSLK